MFLKDTELSHMRFLVESASIGTPVCEALLASYAKDYFPKLFKEIDELRLLSESLNQQVYALRVQNDKISKELEYLEALKKSEK